MAITVTILGCGGSGGVPLVGGIWGNCDPSDARNRRRRPSILVQNERHTLLVDAAPDLRDQLLDANVTQVDAVLFTHAHADHCHGLDDLRPLVYARGGPIPAFADAATMGTLRQRFDYAFESSRASDGFYSALMRDYVIAAGAPFMAGGFTCTAFEQDHGTIPTLGYRIGPVGYSPDAVGIDDAGFAVLDGVALWVVDCLRYAPHPTHAHFARTLAWIDRLRPDRAVFTHMNHTLDYSDVAANCPPGVEPGFDGMTITVPNGS